MRLLSSQISRILFLVMLLLGVIAPISAQAIGTQLDKFTPDRSGDGRGIAIQPGSRNAYYSTQTSLESIFKVDLGTHESQDTLTTNLPGLTDGSHSFGSLAWNGTTNNLSGAEYSSLNGRIDSIDSSSGAVTRLFNSHDSDTTNNYGVDGLGVDSDGSIWMSGEGLGAGTNTLWHFSSSGTTVGFFPLTFKNSGLAVDGDDIWAADINTRIVRKLNKSGMDSGVNFTLPEDILPEGIAIDNCSFTGKKALWVNSAATGGGGSLSAYEIGTSDNAGCPLAAKPGSPKLTDPGAPSTISIKKPTRGYRAGIRLHFSVPTTLDPTGSLFTYIWTWGDYTGFNPNRSIRLQKPVKREPTKEQGDTTHKYQCAGYFKPTVKVLDSFGNQREIAVNKKMAVNFPDSAVARKGGIEASPIIIPATGSHGIFRTDVRKRKKHTRTRVRTVTYSLDGKKLGTRRGPRKSVVAKVSPGPHVLQLRIRFRRPGGRKTIKTCFQLSGA